MERNERTERIRARFHSVARYALKHGWVYVTLMALIHDIRQPATNKTKAMVKQMKRDGVW